MTDDKSAAAHDGRRGEMIRAAAFLLAVAVAIFLRFYWLGIKPFHHDESVNSWFLLDLWRSGNYKYNPENYHGPTLYYFAAAAVRVFGMNDFALRFSPAVFGVLTILMLWPARRLLGLVGTPVAAMMLAVSPGLVYFSRDFIHESSFGFFSLGLAVSAWLYAKTEKFVWIVFGAVSAALLFATKETAIITAVVLALAALCAAVWDIGRRMLSEGKPDLRGMMREIWWDARAALPSLDHLGAAVIIFVFLNVIFYSSFFTNWQGVPDAVKSVLMWTGRGVSKQEHYHVPGYYLGILMKLELPLLIGAIIGALAALWRGARFGLFIFAWAAGVSLGYAIIPYKTPWLMVSMLIPLAILCGVAAEVIYANLRLVSLRMAWVALIVAALIPCARMAWQQNIHHHADNDNTLGYFRSFGVRYNLRPWTDTQYGYVYAQTDEDFLNLEKAIREAADRLPLGKKTSIYIASPDYWPLPWYLRDYDAVTYAGSLPMELAASIVVAAPNQKAQIEGMLGAPSRANVYTLRPGVDLWLYVREENHALPDKAAQQPLPQESIQQLHRKGNNR
jgi:uncharacterized protein (TIGR03663 family)